MRDIKFRAWDSKYKVMRLDTTYAMAFDGTVKLLSKYKDNASGQYHSCGNGIIPMQYTGLKDKNGVEIYEGDIVRYEATKNSFGIHQIIYEAKAAAFLLQAITRASINPIGMKYLGDIARSNKQYDTRTYELCEVIGNIYENPELLDNQRDKRG